MFDFTFEPKITKEFLLSKNNEETYMTHYLGIPVKKGLFKSPLRSDNHVTCSFFRGTSGTLYFKDFADGKCLSFEGVVMEKFGYGDVRSVMDNKYKGVDQTLQDQWLDYVKGNPDWQGLKKWNERLGG